MNIRERLWQVRHGPICRFGGSKSQSSASSSANYDNRSIVTYTLDGGAIAGALGFAQQVAGALGGVASTSINGSNDIASQALDASTAQSAHAFDYADNLFSNALDFAQGNDNRALSAYDRAATMQDNALNVVSTNTNKSLVQYANLFDNALSTVSSNTDKSQVQYANLFDQALNFAGNAEKNNMTAFDRASTAQSTALDQIQNAYADSKGTTQSQQKIMLAVLAVAGIAVLATIHAKG